MLMLCSNGLTSNELKQEISKYIIGAKTAAVVVTADNEYKEKNYHVERVTGELEQFRLHVECFDADVQKVERLLEFDVIEFIGGNPFYLLNSLRQCNAKPVLESLAKDKVLIAWSAGAFVMGPSLDLVNRYSPEMNFMKLEDLTGMGLTEIEVLPHYSKFLERFQRFEETCQEYEREKNCSVIRLNDGEGVVIGNEISIIRTENI